MGARAWPADTAGNFAVGSVSPGSTVKTVEFKMSLLAGVQENVLAIGEVVRKGRSLATCRLEVVGGNDHVVAIGVLPPSSVGEMTLRLYSALNYSQNSARDLRCAVNGA